LSAIVVLIGYYIRTKVTDAPIFVEAQQQAQRVKASSLGAIEVLRRYPRGVFTAMGLRLGENTMYYLVVTFSITYLKVQVHANTVAILRWLLVAHAVHFAVIPLAGHLSDRFGRRPIYFVGAVGGATWGFFAFPMMNSGHNAIIMSAIVIGLVFHGCMLRPSRPPWRRCSQLECVIQGCRWGTKSPPSWPVRWRRSSPFVCSKHTNPRYPSAGIWLL
jgi:hypothetical protein